MSKLLLYCTKAKPYLNCDFGKDNHEEYSGDWNIYLANKQDECSNIVNGKIVAECDFEVEEITNCGTSFMIMKYDDLQESYNYTNKIARDSCLNYNDLRRYLGTNNGYAIHIKNLHIFDKPRKLSDFNKIIETTYGEEPDVTLTRAPQNMMRCCYEKKPKEWKTGVLISIRPEWLCKILNGEKTIEVRRKVLKEMLENESKSN